MKQPPRCPKCRNQLDERGRELADGLPGVRYLVCDGCGWVRAITRKQAKERLPPAGPGHYQLMETYWGSLYTNLPKPGTPCE